MKVISKIYKEEAGNWVWECRDGEIVPLVTWLKTDWDIRVARDLNRSAYNIFKVKVDNKIYPLRHPKGGYCDSLYTDVLIW